MIIIVNIMHHLDVFHWSRLTSYIFRLFCYSTASEKSAVVKHDQSGVAADHVVILMI